MLFISDALTILAKDSARCGTPAAAAVVDKLAKDIARVLAAPELRAWLEEHLSRSNEHDTA